MACGNLPGSSFGDNDIALAIWMLVWPLHCGAGDFQSANFREKKVVMTTAFAVYSLILCAVELPYHFTKNISVSHNQTIYVIGDSISAGIDDKEKTWPDVLGDLSQLKVVNLARAGATVEIATYQTKRITVSNTLVLVEIGGNDLLGRTDRRAFFRH